MIETGSVRLYLVRHGEVAANRRFAFVGRTDDPLTTVGVRQAAALAEFFGDLAVERVVSSPLQRCLATGRGIAAAAHCPLQTDERLIEQSFGEWEGRTRQEIQAAGVTARHRLEAWRESPITAPPGGESLAAVQRRVVELVAELAASRSTGTVLVSHVSPIKALLCEVLGLPLEQVGRFFLDPASISVVDWSSPPMLRLFNLHVHRDWQHERWQGSLWTR